MKIEETNCVIYAQGHFGMALEEVTGLKEVVETNPEVSARERNGYLFQAVFHLQEGNHELYTFLDSNYNTDLEQSFKAELFVLSGAIDGYLTWLSDELIPSIMKDELWEKLQLGSLDTFDDSRTGVFRIVETLKHIDRVLEDLRNIRD